MNLIFVFDSVFNIGCSKLNQEALTNSNIRTGAITNICTVAIAISMTLTFDIGKFVGIFAAIGLALGAIGAALATLGAAFMSLAWWQMPLAILGVLLLISLPSVILTAMKLRRRTLGPILDANSWAVNARAKINISLGKAYTRLPKKPRGSRLVGKDPYAERKGTLWKVLLVLTLLAAGIGAYYALCGDDAETPPKATEVQPQATSAETQAETNALKGTTER